MGEEATQNLRLTTDGAFEYGGGYEQGSKLISLKVELGTVEERWQGQSQCFLSEEQDGWGLQGSRHRERKGLKTRCGD